MKVTSGDEIKDQTGKKMNKDDQYIVWVQTDTKASAGIRWGTSEIVVTAKPIAMPYSVDSQTPLASYQVSSGTKAVQNADGGKMEGVSFDGLGGSGVGSVQTGFYLDTKKIEEAYLAQNKNYDGDTITVYLQAVVYTYDAGSGAVRHQDIRTYDDWKNAEAWGGDTRDSFASHYNIKVTFKRQMVTLKMRWALRSAGDEYGIGGNLKAAEEKKYPANQMLDNLACGSEILEASDPDTGKKRKYVCVGFQYYAGTAAGGSLVSTSYFADPSREEIYMLDGRTYVIHGDKRYNKKGEKRDSMNGAGKTALWYSGKMNTPGFACFSTEYSKAESYTLVWLYLPVADITVTVKSVYTEEGFAGLADGASVNHAGSATGRKEEVSRTIDVVKKGDSWDYLTGNGSKEAAAAGQRIKYRRKHNGTQDCYLWKVKIEGAECVSDDWAGGGKTTSYSTNRMYRRADFQKKTGKWYEDATKMINVRLDDIQKDVDITCYYSITVPAKILVYQAADNGSDYSLAEEGETLYYSYGVEVAGAFSGSGEFITGLGYEKSLVAPYCKKNSYEGSYPSAGATDSIGEYCDIKLSGTSFCVKAPSTPLVLAGFFVDSIPDGKPDEAGYTTVRYVHTDGKYIKIEDKYHPLTWEEKTDVKNTHYDHDWDGDGVNDVDTEELDYVMYSKKAFVSFQPYTEYDNGHSGLNGSIFGISSVVYSYTGRKHAYGSVLFSKPQGEAGSNNMEYSIDESQDSKYHDKLVVVAVYEDCCAPGGVQAENVTEEPYLPWNWPVPEGFSSNASASDPSLAGGSKQYLVNVSGTGESSVFNAQLGIPSSDYVRVKAQVPRYQTSGYWTKHNLKALYQIVAYKANNSSSVKKITTDQYDRDKETGPGWYTNEKHDTLEEEFPVYGGSLDSTMHMVERSAVYYKLGDAHVWDADIVRVKNDSFSDGAGVSGGICTLAPGFSSGATFTVAAAVNYEMPPVAAAELKINLGLGSSPADGEDLAESMIGEYKVCNDQVEFSNGEGYKKVLTTSSTGLCAKVAEPEGILEAGMTPEGIFDSAKAAPEGIQLIPTVWNGHHDTVSSVTYRPVYGYKTMGSRIIARIEDDGDDDVEIYTPTVNFSKVYLTPGSLEKDADGTLLHPDKNYNQRCYGEGGYHPETVVLDMEYKMKLSVNGAGSSLPGYGSQNYARYLEKDGSGNPYMQVKFPFPAEMTLTLPDGSLDTRYYLSGTWISLEVPLGSGEKIYTFLVPSWAHEYDSSLVMFRSITINARTNNPGLGMQGLRNNDQPANGAVHKNEKNYVAYYNQEVQTVGRLYGFQIIDISDYPAWQSVFREFDEARGEYKSALSGRSYRAGVNDQNGFSTGLGRQWVVPTIDGSHPSVANAGSLGTGFKIRYKMESVGEYFSGQDTIEIEPEFYYVNEDGEYLQEDGTYSRDIENRRKVDVYYNETINGSAASLVKVGSGEDKLNQKTLNVTGEDFGILAEEIRKTAGSLGISEDRLNKSTNQYSFGSIKMTGDMRTFVGDKHDTVLKNGDMYKFNQKLYSFAGLDPETQAEYLNGKEMKPDLSVKLLKQQVSQDAILKSVQNWYGEYYLPSDTYATVEDWETVREQVSSGFDGSEKCWLQGGFLVVNFQPVLRTNGKCRLRYDNTHLFDVDGVLQPDECNMWEVEGYQKKRFDYNSRELWFKEGDVILYSLGGGSRSQGGSSGGSSSANSAKDSYGSHGTH